MNDLFIAMFFVGLPFAGGLWALHSKLKKYGWAGFKKRVWDSFLQFLRTTAWAVLVVAYFVGFVGISLNTEMDANQLSAMLFLYFLLGVVALYYLTGIKRRGTKKISKIIAGDLGGLKNLCQMFLKDLGIIVGALFSLTGWLLKALVWIVLIGLCIWLIVALGPLWIIAIILLLILFAVANK